MKPRIQSYITLAVLLLSAFTLLAATPSFGADNDSKKFNPALYNEETLPSGILYMDTGPVDAMTEEGIVVDDSLYSLATNAGFFLKNGKKATINSLYRGKKVDVYVNAEHEAVYVVLK